MDDLIVAMENFVPLNQQQRESKKVIADEIERLTADNKELLRLNGVLADTFSDLQHSADKEIERLTALLNDMTEKSTVVLGKSLEQNKEIERLTAALERIASGDYDVGAIGIAVNALAALKEKDDE